MSRWPQLPELRVTRALWVPSDGTIDVNGLLGVFAQGVRVEISTPVSRIESTGRGANVVTPRGTIAARVVVDASGAWAGELVGGDTLNVVQASRVHHRCDRRRVHTPWLWHLGAGEMYLRVDGNGVLASPCDAAKCPPGHQEADLVGEAHVRRLLDEADSALGGRADHATVGVPARVHRGSQDAARSRSESAVAGVGRGTRRTWCDRSAGGRRARRDGRRRSAVTTAAAGRRRRSRRGSSSP